MTKDEALKLALSTLDEVRQETFRLSRDGQKLYAEDKVWSTIISIKEVLAQEQEPVAWEQFYPDIGKPQIAFNAEVIGYVAPQRKPLSDEEIGQAVRDAHIAFCLDKHQTYEHALTRAIEAAHGIKE